MTPPPPDPSGPPPSAPDETVPGGTAPDEVGLGETPSTTPDPFSVGTSPEGPSDDQAESVPDNSLQVSTEAGEVEAPTGGDAPSASDHATLVGWIRVLAGAVLFAVALRVLVFEAYRIPSSSMEDTLLIGDFVLVSKLHYGPRVLGARLPGFSEVGRGDVMVFNHPPDLTPEVERRTPYIKRVVGLPGDTIAIRAKRVFAGRAEVPGPRLGRLLWTVGGRLPTGGVLDTLGLGGRVERLGRGAWAVSATADQARRLAEVEGVESVEPYVRPVGDGSAGFPAALRYSLDDYGPLVVPQSGLAVTLSDETWPVYRAVIERFEGHTAERTAEGFLIDGRPADAVTFRQDYYLVLGDSRDDSADSRTWGFVPRDHVIGRAVGVYFSWDEEAGKPRWSRIGSGVE